MEDFIKNIVLEKNYFELSPKEKQSIHEWASNEEEFDALKAVLLATQAMTVRNASQLSTSVKQRLDDRFAAKYAHKNETAWNKFLIFFLPSDTQFFKKPAFQLVMVALIVAIVIPFLWQNEPAQYAMNNERKSLEVEKYTAKTIKEVQKEKLDSKGNSDLKIPKISEGKDLAEPVIEEEYLLDEIESISLDDQMVGNNSSDELSRSSDFASPTEYQLEEITEKPSPSIVSAEKSFSRRKEAKSLKNKVETIETLDLLTALY